jgi:hypothetical protein
MSIPEDFPNEPLSIYEMDPAAAFEDLQIIERNVAATDALRETLRAEAGRSRFSVFQEGWFELESTAASASPTLAEIPDPAVPGSGFLVGLRPDGIGQIVLLSKETDGVTGRVIVTVQEDVATRLQGTKLFPWIPKHGLAMSVLLDGQLAAPELLERLNDELPQVFEAKRAQLYGNQISFRLRKFADAALSPIFHKPRQVHSV